MPGILSQVDTLLAGIGYDIDRQLDWEDQTPLTFEFIVPDRTQPDGWNVLLELTEGFNRVTPKEETRGTGSEVIFGVADLTGTVAPVLVQSDLHVRVDGQIYPVSTTPPIAPNEAQVYILTCKTKIKRGNFDTTKK